MAEREPGAGIFSEENEETYSLASILAEYKTEAFIRSERRLSREELQQQAEAILADMRRSVEEELSGESGSQTAEADSASPIPAEETAGEMPAEESSRTSAVRLPDSLENPSRKKPRKSPKKAARMP